MDPYIMVILKELPIIGDHTAQLLPVLQRMDIGLRHL